MTAQTFLRHDRDSITGRTVEVVKDIVPDVCFVGLVGTSASTVNGQDTDIIRRQPPDCKRTSQGRDTGVTAFQHTVGRQCVLLLSYGFRLHIGHPSSEETVVKLLTLALAELNFIAKELLFIGEPLCDLLTTEGKLSRAILQVKNRERVLRGDFASNR